MHYIFLTLGAVLIGISLGALMSGRGKLLAGGSVLSLALGVATVATGSWHFLVAGLAVYLLAQLTLKGSAKHA
jgi:hypothetical protein